MDDRSTVVLNAVLRLFKPAARLLLHFGVGYPAFAGAVKRVFLAAAQEELRSRGMAQTHSALTLLSGVHRRDVRALLRAPAPAGAEAPTAGLEPAAHSLASEVAMRWLFDRRYSGPEGAHKLSRGSEAGSFDALVAGVSSDIRPRAMLDELKRLGVVNEDEDGCIRLAADSFAPRQGFKEMSWLFSGNLHDHIAAAARNLQGQANFLEQSISVDRISGASASGWQAAAVQAWKQSFQTLVAQAQKHSDRDGAGLRPEERTWRARFGVYFYSEDERTTSSKGS